MKTLTGFISIMLSLTILCTGFTFVDAYADSGYFYDDLTSGNFSNYTMSAENAVCTSDANAGTLTFAATSSTSCAPYLYTTVSGNSNLIIEYKVKTGGKNSSNYSRHGLQLYFGEYGSSNVVTILNRSTFYNDNRYNSYYQNDVVVWVDFSQNTYKAYIDGVLKAEGEIIAGGISDELAAMDKVINFTANVKGASGFAEYSKFAVYEMPSAYGVNIENADSVGRTSMNITTNVPIYADASTFVVNGENAVISERGGLNAYTLSWETPLNLDTQYTLSASLKVKDGTEELHNCAASFKTFAVNYNFDYITYDNGFTAESLEAYSSAQVSTVENSSERTDIINSRLKITLSSGEPVGVLYKSAGTNKKFVVDYVASASYISSARYGRQGVRLYKSSVEEGGLKNQDNYVSLISDGVKWWSSTSESGDDKHFVSVVDMENGTYSSYVDEAAASGSSGTFKVADYAEPLVGFVDRLKGTGAYVNYKYITVYEMQEYLTCFVKDASSVQTDSIVLGFNMPIDIASLSDGFSVDGIGAASVTKLSEIDENCANYYEIKLNDTLNNGTTYDLELDNVKSIDLSVLSNDRKSFTTISGDVVSIGDITLTKVGNKVTGSVEVINTTGEVPDICLVLAAYVKSGNVYELVRYIPVTCQSEQNCVLTDDISTANNVNLVKAFVWDSIDGLKPIGKGVSLDLSSN